MPAALPADWPAIRTMAVQGVTQAEISRQTGIAPGTIAARSKREGWLVEARAMQVSLQAARVEKAVAAGQMQEHARDGHEAALAAQADHSRRSRSAGLEYAALTTEAAAVEARTTPLVALERAPLVKSALQGAALAGDWSATVQVGVRIDIYAPTMKEARVIELDVEQPS